MRISRELKVLSVVALCAAVFLVPTIAMTQDKPDMAAKAIATRQGYMKLVVWEAGPLFGMAKGKMAYDASVAQAHAANLRTVAEYPAETLFMSGTSNADRPGKTRTLPKAWEDAAGFNKAFSDWRAAVTLVANEAGKGQEALAAAVGEMGKTCGGCHKPYRAKDF